MDELRPGCFVKATRGREMGQLFIILYQQDEYVYLVDGKTRTLKKPKKKNRKHVKHAGFYMEESHLLSAEEHLPSAKDSCLSSNEKIRSDLLLEGAARDEDIKRAIKLYRRERDVQG